MKYAGFVFIFFVAGCAAVPVRGDPTFSQSHRVETIPLPEDPERIAIPSNIPKEEWLEAQEAGVLAKRSGILVSEARAYRDGLFRISYRELRAIVMSEQSVWAAHRELYEERLQQADRKIRDMQPDWFTRHEGQLGVVGGFIVGASLTVGLTYAIHRTVTSP
jgi:hypothetical protein